MSCGSATRVFRWRIVCADESTDAIFAARNTGDHHVLHRQRRRSDAVTEHGIGHLGLPQYRAGARIERDQSRIQCAEEDAIPQHRDPAIDAIAFVRIHGLLFPLIFPKHAAGECIAREHLARRARRTGNCKAHCACNWRTLAAVIWFSGE